MNIINLNVFVSYMKILQIYGKNDDLKIDY